LLGFSKNKNSATKLLGKTFMLFGANQQILKEAPEINI